MDADTWQTWRADTLSGTPEQAIERIRRFEELGVEEIVISASALPFAVDDPEMVDVLAERVMAPLRSAS
jgi:alkanesulfonate monooxygenase SsuD/methylene tetrahydromethanopterin reductase-like flavin-dependent oxidoreductase (luciferase family)